MNNSVRFIIRIFFWPILITYSTTGLSQSDSLPSDKLVISSILITGNHKTKSHYILRELPFRIGDTLSFSQLTDLLPIARTNIYNTKLFIDVAVYPEKISDSFVVIAITVKERWYTFPIPFVELADRSFNVWWQKYHADLRRLSYGINFFQQNLSGRNDNMSVLATVGFNRQFQIEYTTPYLTPGMQSRLKFGFSILGSREIPYITSNNNKLLYYQSNATIRKNWLASASFVIRKNIKKTELIKVSLNNINLFDSIHLINPQYFKGQASNYLVPEIEYKGNYDDVDNAMYPLKGAKYQLILSKRGLGWSGDVNRLFASAYAKFYKPLGRDWYGSFRLSGQIMFPFDQPYYNTKAIGYSNDYIRGYEFYVIDGVASFIARADLKKKLFHISLPTLLRQENYRRIPFTFYAKIFADAGAAYNRKQTELGNTLQIGTGVGIDIVTLYDLAVSINFGINKMGETGYYLHKE